MISAKILFNALAVIVVTCQVVTTAAAETSQWTLTSATRRILEASPEHRAAEAEIDVRKGELTQADAWPNPTIELRADNKLGQGTGGGGSNLTQVAISQPLRTFSTHLFNVRNDYTGCLFLMPACSNIGNIARH